MTVNGLVTGLIVFRILQVFLEVKAAQACTSVEGTLGSTGSTKFQHIIFIIIESGMTLLVIQLVRLLLQVWVVDPFGVVGQLFAAFDYVIVINQMFNVIIRSVHFHFFCFTEIFTWLGHHTNNNCGADLNEIVL